MKYLVSCLKAITTVDKVHGRLARVAWTKSVNKAGDIYEYIRETLMPMAFVQH